MPWTATCPVYEIEKEDVMCRDQGRPTPAIRRRPDGALFGINGLRRRTKRHAGGPVTDDPTGCPRHFGQFDNLVGAAERGPPVDRLTIFPAGCGRTMVLAQ